VIRHVRLPPRDAELVGEFRERDWVVNRRAVHPPNRAAIQAVAPSFGVELTPVEYRDADEIERGIVAFARRPNDSLIVRADSARPEASDPCFRS
jgi:hypothetical protein